MPLLKLVYLSTRQATARLVLSRRSRRPLFLRSYATSSSGSSRRSVTVANDDGRVGWTDLSAREKAARTTQQTINLGVVLIGAVMTGGVFYLLYDQVFSKDSKISHFNRAVDEIKASPRAIELLGPSKKINAYGEATWNKWTRNRAIASTIKKDRAGREHMLMHFNVEGPKGRGIVNVRMVRPTPSASFEYELLSLDVPGHPTVYLRNIEASKKDDKRKGFNFLGVNWSATTSAYEPVNTALDHGLVKIRATVNIGSNPNLITEPQGSIESDQYGMGREYVDDRQTSLCVVPIDR